MVSAGSRNAAMKLDLLIMGAALVAMLLILAISLAW
jgi:hypothetical protein